jgi:hypothetical protein
MSEAKYVVEKIRTDSPLSALKGGCYIVHEISDDDTMQRQRGQCFNGVAEWNDDPCEKDWRDITEWMPWMGRTYTKEQITEKCS